MVRGELSTRRQDAVRAWTSFVEHGDEVEALVRPEILTQLDPVGGSDPDRREGGAARRRVGDRGDLAGLAAADRGRERRAGAAPYRRGRRPRHRGHRRGHPDPVDLRRPGDAPQGGDGELRGRRPLGRRVGRHQRPRPRQPAGRSRRWCSAPSTTPRSCTTGSAGRRRSTTRHRRQARRHRPLDHLGPHPPDRARDRPGDGPADRVRDAALGPPPVARWRTTTATPGW